MPDPIKFTDILDDIKDMQDKFEQPSCKISDDPMVKYPDPGTGKPPILNFNIPQATVFNTYGKMAVSLPKGTENQKAYKDMFREFCSMVPTNNYWNVVDKMAPDQIFQLMNPYVAAAPPVVGTFLPYSTADGVTHYRDSSIRPLSVGSFSSAARYATAAPMPGMAHAAGLTAEPYTVVAAAPAPTRSPITDLASMGFRPVFTTRLSGRGQVVKYIPKPPAPIPRLFIIEEYTTGAYLGDYGAGRVVKTFSLLPGERTTISVRTYKDMESHAESSKNMLDSFSESSAKELDTLIQHEDGDMTSESTTDSNSGSSFGTSSSSKNSSMNLSLNAGLNLGMFNFGAGFGMSESEASSDSNGWNSSNSHSYTGARSSNQSNLNNALSKHVQQSNANRQININTSTSDTARSGEEDSTVRYLENYNKSRVLNFTFRQLLQEYITVTSITNLKFVYTNGYAESFRMVDLHNLDNMLVDIIKDCTDPGMDIEHYRDLFRCLLLQPYCSILDYQGKMMPFLYRKEIIGGKCTEPLGPDPLPYEVPIPRFPGFDWTAVCPPKDEYFWAPIPDLHQIYDPSVPGHEGMNLRIPGIILSAKKQTLQTSSVIADALLGRGEALDCFNQNAQNADTQAAYLSNMVTMQRLNDNIQTSEINLELGNQQVLMGAQQVLLSENQVTMSEKQIDKMDLENDILIQQKTLVGDLITADPVVAAANYKKVYSKCCPTPQNTGGCGCGNCAD